MGIFSKYKREKETGPVEWLVVGLGNPGEKYLRTRHNCGWLTVDNLAAKLGVSVTRAKFKSMTAQADIGGKKCLLMKPTTMMNASGEAVVEAMNFYKIPLGRIVVISDDVSLDVGRIRIRKSGSDGGQKGLRSIITLTGSDEFIRLRIGIGAKPHPDYDMAAWVLSEFSDSEKPEMFDAFCRASEAIGLIVAGKVDEAMTKYNR